MQNFQLDSLIAELATTQHGVFSRAQAFDLGATRALIDRRIKTGRWIREGTRVLRLPGTQPTYEQTLFVAWLSWGTDAVISHCAAAKLHGLMGFAARGVELTVPRTRKRNGPGVVHTNALRRNEITQVGGLPATTVARTFIDVAGICDPTIVGRALDDALRRKVVSVKWLAWSVGLTPPGRRGIGVIGDLLRQRGFEPGTDSQFEIDFLRRLLKSGLPEPEAQFEVWRDGQLLGRIDFMYPEAGLAIEVDSYTFHSIYTDWERDRLRLNDLTEAGIRVIHVTKAQFERDPDGVLARIRGALRAA